MVSPAEWFTTIDFLPSGAGIVPRLQIGVAEREYIFCGHTETLIGMKKSKTKSREFTLESLAQIELAVRSPVRSRVVANSDLWHLFASELDILCTGMLTNNCMGGHEFSRRRRTEVLPMPSRLAISDFESFSLR